jgi:hypothetical protein
LHEPVSQNAARFGFVADGHPGHGIGAGHTALKCASCCWYWTASSSAAVGDPHTPQQPFGARTQSPGLTQTAQLAVPPAPLDPAEPDVPLEPAVPLDPLLPLLPLEPALPPDPLLPLEPDAPALAPLPAPLSVVSPPHAATMRLTTNPPVTSHR